MRWKFKAKVQNAISALPQPLSYQAYYWIQRHFGSLRKIDPLSRFRAGIATWKLLKKLDRNPINKVFFEVGTGRVPITPIAYWLMGAKKIITIDANPYLEAELLKGSMMFVLKNPRQTEELFGPLLDRSRMIELLDFCSTNDYSTDMLLELCNILYVAPGDAADTNLADGCIDFHTSYNVLEHIPPSILKDIVKEGNRLVNDSGLFIHKIDYSDHFSHSDKSISAINFLQYSASEWNKYAGNRYMYMNRLRHDDFLELFASLGHEIILSTPETDSNALDALATANFKLDESFQSKSKYILSVVGSWIVSENVSSPA